jgi:hypothetical protein
LKLVTISIRLAETAGKKVWGQTFKNQLLVFP